MSQNKRNARQSISNSFENIDEKQSTSPKRGSSKTKKEISKVQSKNNSFNNQTKEKLSKQHNFTQSFSPSRKSNDHFISYDRVPPSGSMNLNGVHTTSFS